MGQKRKYSPRKSWLRERVVAELRQNGPVEDAKGRALQELADRVGHHSSMSVGNVIRQLEAEGNAVRMTGKAGVPLDADGNPSPHVRRTYRVALTDEFIATLPPIEVPAPVIEPVAVANDPEASVESAPVVEAAKPVIVAVEVPPGLPEGLDYGLFVNTLLGVVFKNMAASEDVEELRELRVNYANSQAALVEAKQVIDALGAEVKAERKHRGKVEDEAAALSLEVESLKAEIKAINETGLDTSRVRVYSVAEQMDDRSRKVMDQLMRAVPTTRG